MEKNQLLFLTVPAGTLFLLSFLTGIVSGVGFLTVIIRALLFGIIFGAGGFAVSIVVKKFLPELLEFSGQEEENASGEEDFDSKSPASTVDIVVEDDGDGDEKLYSTGGGEENSFVEEYTEEEPVSAASGNDDGSDKSDEPGDSGGQKREADTESDVEELQSVDEDDDRERDDEGGDEGGGDEIEELGSAEDDSDSSLPDLDSFSDSFQSVAESQDENGQASRSGASMEIDIMGTHEDSATVAKAVRTIMKRDQEG